MPTFIHHTGIDPTSNVTHTNSGSISQIGNSFNTPKGVYHLMGNTLKGPGGKTWIGVNSADEARGIILGDQ